MSTKIQKFEHRQDMKKRNFEVFHYKENNPDFVGIHHHDFYEIYFFLGGDVSYWVEGESYHLSKGDLLLISPMELHQPIAKSGTAYERMVLWIDRNYLSAISTEQTDLTACFQLNPNNRIKLIHSNVLMRGRISELFELLNREAHSSEFGGNVYAEGLFIQLLVEVNRMAKQDKNAAEPIESPTPINRIISYMNNNYHENISLDMLSKKFYVSKYYLSHEFSEKIGISIYQYLILKRLTIAKELLAEGHTAAEVCTACGFHNYTTFYRIFKEKYGISPSKFTEQYR